MARTTTMTVRVSGALNEFVAAYVGEVPSPGRPQRNSFSFTSYSPEEA